MARLLNISPDDYHALPGFSASCAKTLIAQSPLHAWQEHPEYGAKGKKATKAMNRGTAIGTFLLGKGKRIARLPYDSWTTKKSQEDRDSTEASGVVALTRVQYDDYQEAAAAIKRRLIDEHAKDARVPAALDGVSEQAMEWHEDSSSGQVLCRGMMDHVWLDRGRILDLKVIEDASPAAIERSAESLGHAIQSTAYVRGLVRVMPELMGRIEFLFLFVEPHPPYAINIVKPDGVFDEIGERRWLRAVETWGRCLKKNEWPAYGSGIKRISPPPWALAREGYTVDE